jgi:hypothetical protein
VTRPPSTTGSRSTGPGSRNARRRQAVICFFDESERWAASRAVQPLNSLCTDGSSCDAGRRNEGASVAGHLGHGWASGTRSGCSWAVWCWTWGTRRRRAEDH